MLDDEILLRRLEREIKAREMAECIGEKKVTELYEINLRLEEAFQKQKEINENLFKLTKELKNQKMLTETERATKNLLKNILSSSKDYSIIGTNLEGTILVWNEGARHNYGYEESEMVGKENIEILHTPEDIQCGNVKNFITTVLQKGKNEQVFTGVRKNGSQFINSVVMSILHDELGSPHGYLIIAKDITEEKKLEKKLIKSNQELVQFAYVVSHDLKSPLRSIEKLSEWIIEDNYEKLDEKSKENLNFLRRRVNRMSNLIDGVLQYSRLDHVETDVEMVDTNRMVQEIFDEINSQKKFLIQYEHLPVFRTRKTLLSQVLANLMNNGIKHHHCETGNIKIGVTDFGNFYLFSVKDDGPGIEAEYFDRIFLLFQTLKSKDELESTGIGLTICKKIVESQGGKITISSEVGKGATFFFTWPKDPDFTLGRDSIKDQV
ncbi:MAG: PAS domain-containing sensor histidine kinase [Coxiella sp. RIFCSPHIGHO2_12_FULL_42_15]|nr:MAG: PAS domain-containing sensor histidine kinase [Coxiella sp. RIFCSPHIGHO2_12_FULL_42_15]